MKKLFAFTLAEGRLGTQVCSYPRATAKGGQIQASLGEAIQPIEKAEQAKQNMGLIHDTNLFPYSPISLFPRKRTAFTLAEVLVTLAIIGVVAALTIPNLIQSHNEKAWATAKSVFEKRLEVATKQMNTEEKLAGYKSTMDFVNELKKYIKITRVCDSNELTKCFTKTILNASNVEFDISTFSSQQLTKENWGTETLGVQFANGVNALIAYNPNTTQDPYNNQFNATAASMAILYDVSGNKNPNTIGKDINLNDNVKSLGCMITPDLIDGICISKILTSKPISKADCEAQKDDLGITTCINSPDFWAGAVKACGGVNNLPTRAQLTEIAKYVYDTDAIPSSGTVHINWHLERASLFHDNSLGGPIWFNVWSGEETSEERAYLRNFNPTYTYMSARWRQESGLAFCLEQ